jgi:hypothetical protein
LEENLMSQKPRKERFSRMSFDQMTDATGSGESWGRGLITAPAEHWP